MTPSRETIYAALFQVLQGIPGLNGSSRQWVHYSHVSPAEQPYLVLREFGETYEWRLGGPGPATKILIANAILYTYNANPEVEEWSASILNNMVDAIEATLHGKVEQGQAQTLGNLVRWCRLQGRQTIYLGSEQQQSVTMLEIHSLAMGAGSPSGG
jgi:hypothetical protein